MNALQCKGSGAIGQDPGLIAIAQKWRGNPGLKRPGLVSGVCGIEQVFGWDDALSIALAIVGQQHTKPAVISQAGIEPTGSGLCAIGGTEQPVGTILEIGRAHV